MVLKKVFVFFMILLVFSLSIIGSMTFLSAAEEDSVILEENFEEGINNWGPRGDEIVEISTEESYSGTNSLKVSSRTATWNGPSIELTDKLTKGVTYDFGVWVNFTGGSYSNTQNFNLSFQYNDGSEDYYMNLSTETVNKGGWTYLEGEYTVPLDAVSVFLYVETPYSSSATEQDLLDFYIDDFKVAIADLPEIENDIDSLKEVYSDYFKIGGAATTGEIALKPSKDIFNKHYNSLTPGNELKPDSLLDYDETILYLDKNEDGEVNPQVKLSGAKSLLDFARDNNMPVRGHTLVWHSQTPDWFFREGYSKDESANWVSKEVMLQRMENYIKNVMDIIESEYPDVEFYAWDVVNEAVDPNTETGMRNPGSNNETAGKSLWMETIGEEYIEKAFEYAREYAPDGCKLFYNDYNEYESVKSDFIIGILENLIEKDLVDGMGMQSHWIMGYPSVSMFETAVRKYDALGLEIQLTELDIKQPDGSDYALTQQAERYKQLFNKLVDLKEEGLNITNVVFWGVTDATSWLGGYPLLFDENYIAKPAFYSVIGALKPVEIPEDEIGKPIVDFATTNSGNAISQKYTVGVENGTIDLSKLKIIYTADGISSEEHNIWCDYAGLQLNVAPWSVNLGDDVLGIVQDGSFTITIGKSVELVLGTGTLNLNMRFAKTDWSTYGELSNEKIEVYYDGELIE
ncbi:MAG: endo-1,4-beta-xylanase [Clostridiales bacterium]